jgi:hypothetical protein
LGYFGMPNSVAVEFYTDSNGPGRATPMATTWPLVQRFAPIDPVPEPSSWVLVGTLLVLFGLAAFKRRTRSASRFTLYRANLSLDERSSLRFLTCKSGR